ncbi:hypothetical protein [Brevibacterium sp. CFH 10365]|uniref:hypothetical protein n=1 Tax=Brevibacterium sp. CFH 10365 TaxID=2585207 RepID=UPI0012664D4D|nr:hypothetical protein [Brevibacterium sp. CFH 10365]
MSRTVSISIDKLWTLIDAANEWSCELDGHIAPASRGFGDDESAESQEQQAAEIDAAITYANTAIIEAQKG